MVADRRDRRNHPESALGRRRVSQSEDLLRCRFSLSRAVPAQPGMNREASVSPFGHLSCAAAGLSWGSREGRYGDTSP